MSNDRLRQAVAQAGFDSADQIIHLFVGGSELHGAKVGATDDLDVYGVFVEPAERVIGFGERDHFVWSTASDERRNGPEDIDVTLYSLRRWAELAVKGNATALHFLFADSTADSSPTWQLVQEQRELFLSKKSAKQFIGFANNQKQRITGEKGHGAKGLRHEYIGRHGYDTKAAMHCLRLYLECIELMSQGTITLPRPEKEFLIGVRSGEYTREQFFDLTHDFHAKALHAASASALPEDVDLVAVSQLITEVHLRHWRLSLALSHVS